MHFSSYICIHQITPFTVDLPIGIGALDSNLNGSNSIFNSTSIRSSEGIVEATSIVYESNCSSDNLSRC